MVKALLSSALFIHSPLAPVLPQYNPYFHPATLLVAPGHAPANWSLACPSVLGASGPHILERIVTQQNLEIRGVSHARDSNSCRGSTLVIFIQTIPTSYKFHLKSQLLEERLTFLLTFMELLFSALQDPFHPVSLHDTCFLSSFFS